MKLLSLALPLMFSASLVAAELQPDKNIQILTLNGEPIDVYRKVIDLGAGPQIITVRYDALFESNAEDHEFVRSSVQVIRFEAMPNEQYRISVPSMDLNSARRFAEDPHFQLTSSDGQRIAHRTWSRDELLAELLARP
ncbi:DUF2057 family protein [Ferrimonas balearica]|uniref:DUF2057 family protein n=1 Tax=Ferrimonas balearica TaxID=44012 RepID=UPI001C99B69C|nr:DUF2057 family protein [Ferrimonas balearica]MBY5991830.1 DUF2057 domain-containing protein [Ferrimonas balearica]